MSNSKSAVSRTVCIVDDDPAIRDSLAMLLKARGYSAEAYGSADEFLNAKNGNPGCGCLVLDYHMPKGSGIDLLNELRSRQIATPAILITGRGDASIAERARKAGALAVLDKPVSRVDLFKWLDQALAGSADTR